MSEKFRIDGHLYFSSTTRFFRDGTEITLAEFYDAFISLLRQH
jgi:hypothetical protein